MMKIEIGGNSVEANIFNIMFLRTQRGVDTSVDLAGSLIFSAKRKKIKFLTGAYRTNIGYVAWADICKESARRILKNKTMPVFDYEFDEGNICLILDVLVCQKESQEAVRQLKLFLTSKKIILYVRNNRAVFVKKGRLIKSIELPK